MACRMDASCRCAQCASSMQSCTELGVPGAASSALAFGGGSGGGYGGVGGGGGHWSDNQAAMGDRMLSALQTFGPAQGAEKLMLAERDAATEAVRSDMYVVWRSDRDGGTDCTRVGPKSRCFCGHRLELHAGGMGPSACGGHTGGKSSAAVPCRCTRFAFMPTRPEEVGMGYLCRRKEFDIRRWKPPCRCKHTHTMHEPQNGLHPCRKCGCSGWDSSFACTVSDRAEKNEEIQVNEVGG